MATRGGLAGKALGLAIIEIMHLFYQNNTTINFLKELLKVLEKEKKKREN